MKRITPPKPLEKEVEAACDRCHRQFMTTKAAFVEIR